MDKDRNLNRYTFDVKSHRRIHTQGLYRVEEEISFIKKEDSTKGEYVGNIISQKGKESEDRVSSFFPPKSNKSQSKNKSKSKKS